VAILSDDMRRVVEEQQLGLVATVCPDGSPNVHFYEARGSVDPRGRIRAVVLVTVERALAVTSPAYDLGVDENELRRRHVARLTGAAGGPRLPEP
jgi:hypothetical protein